VNAAVVLYTRRLCGICDDTAIELRRLRDDLGFTLIERDIDDDDALRARYNDLVPVVAIGERIVAQAPIEPETLRDALVAALA
jgi:hypothetical protein